ncbi:uncharacterized protein ACN427_009667 isoform 1-T2 [Glossina fuscipes fuscipes]
MSVFNEKFHCVLSRLLWDYPKLWRPRGPQFGLFEELAEKVSQEMQEQVSAEKVKSTLKDIRKRLERLNKGLSASMKTYAYLWYARELQCWRAVEILQNAKMMQKKRRREASPEPVGIDLADAAPLKTTEETNDFAPADLDGERNKLEGDREREHIDDLRGQSQLLRASESSARQLLRTSASSHVSFSARQLLRASKTSARRLLRASKSSAHQLLRASEYSTHQLLRTSAPPHISSFARQLLRASESSARQLLHASESSARQLLRASESSARQLLRASAPPHISSSAHKLLRASESSARQLLRASESSARQLLCASESSAHKLLCASESSARQLLRTSASPCVSSSARQLHRASESSAH